MNRYLAEFSASFIMIFIGTGSMILSDQTNGWFTHFDVCLTWGIVVAGMIYLFGKFSGAHMNPAVTISLTFLRAHPKHRLLSYLGIQFAAGIAASVLLAFLAPDNEYLGATLPSGSAMQSFYIEFLLTFGLMAIVLLSNQFHHIKFKAGRSLKFLEPIIIGATIFLGAYFWGPISGASMNPMRSFGPAIVSGHTEHLWVYLIATTLGALAASAVWYYWKKK